MLDKHYEATIIGAGFYGCLIAIYLVEQRGFKKVAIVEREPQILLRASYNNQARVHNGYHYPRSFTTAFRSRVNMPRFMRDWHFAVDDQFCKLYAIARRNSKVTSAQFVRFCQQIGAYIEPATAEQMKFFSNHLIESVFQVHEYAFNAKKLAEWIEKKLAEHQINVFFDSNVTSVTQSTGGNLLISVEGENQKFALSARYVFNCTYSGINQIKNDNDTGGVVTKLKHEITEMGLLEMPEELTPYGITVMDGPFFSVMPFPARNLHSLSHVRYTPHINWQDSADINPYEKMKNYPRVSRVDRMIRDTARYIPLIERSIHIDSLFEIKTVLVKNEGDDGRPILYEVDKHLRNYFTILGGKIDNIYDVLERLDNEIFSNK